MSEMKNETRDFLDHAKEKISPIVDDVKEKAAPIVDDLREKAAPVIEKAKGAAESAIEAVKEGAEKIGDLFEEKKPGLNVKNELFDELEAQAIGVKDAAKAKADELQRRLEELMGGKKEEPKE